MTVHGTTDQKLATPPLTSNRIVTLLTCQVAMANGWRSAAEKCSNQTDLRPIPTDRVRHPDLPQRPSLTAPHLVCIQVVLPTSYVRTVRCVPY
jgi:hypothetical protein